MADINNINNGEQGLTARQKLLILIDLYNKIAISNPSFVFERIDPSTIKDASPSATKFLRDDGTWQALAPTFDDVLTNGDTTSKSATFTNGNTEVKILPSGYVQLTDTTTGAYCVINPYTISNNSGDGKYAQLDWSDGLILKTSNVTGAKSATIKASNIDTSNRVLQLPNADGTLAPITNTVTSGDTVFAPSGDAVYQALLALQNIINNIQAGLKWKDSVVVMCDSNVYLNAPGSVLDGETMNVGDRVALVGQSVGPQNGLYVWNGPSTLMTRTYDANTGALMLQATFGIEKGTYHDQTWTCSTDAPITLGTTSLTFIKSSNTTYTAGSYLSLTGNTFAVDLAALKGYFDTVYKAVFSENTAFNKNFGTGVTNVPEIGATLTASKALVTDASGKLSTSSTTATEIGYVNGVTAAIQTQLDNKSTQLALVTSSQFNPADATSYYYGVNLVGYSVPSTGGARKMYVNRSGTITACSIVAARGGGFVSNEKASFYIHVNGGAGVLVTNNFDFSTSTTVDMNVTGLSISVSAGDYVEVEMLSPTWATNPINVSINTQLTIK